MNSVYCLPNQVLKQEKLIRTRNNEWTSHSQKKIGIIFQHLKTEFVSSLTFQSSDVSKTYAYIIRIYIILISNIASICIFNVRFFEYKLGILSTSETCCCMNHKMWMEVHLIS